MRSNKYIIVVLSILAIHLTVLMFFKFTAWPEMTLWPYLMTKGLFPYKDIAIAHTPLMLINLTVFYKLFGTGVVQLKIFTWILIIFSDIALYLTAKKLWNKNIAVIALIFYAFLGVFFDGNGLWFDLCMGVLIFISFYFIRIRRWFWGGFFWALAFITKQTAVWFVFPIIVEMILNLQQHYVSKKNIHYRLSLKKIARFIVGCLIVFLPFVLILAVIKILPDFISWAINFGIFVLPRAQGQIQLPSVKTLIVSVFPLLIFIPLFIKTRFKNTNVFLWALAGTMGAYPRFEYFHLQPSIYFSAIAAALVFTEFKNYKKLIKVFLVVYLSGFIYLFLAYAVRNFNEGIRFYEPEVQDIVLYVKYNTSPGDKIFVLNWWDNIYPLSETLPSVDPWVPQLSWYLKIPGIQEKMIQDLKNSPPKLIVYKPYTDYGLSSYIPDKIYNYITSNYRISKTIDGIEILIK